MKGLKEEGRLQDKIKEILGKVGEEEVKIVELRRLGQGGKIKVEMVIVKLENEEMKKKIIRNKWRLRGEEVWIEEDLTWEERRTKWKMRQFAIKEERRGKNVRMGEGGLWIDGVWRRWDEEEGVLEGKGKEGVERRREERRDILGGFRE